MPKKFSWSFWKSKKKSKFIQSDDTDQEQTVDQKQNESETLIFQEPTPKRQSNRVSQDSLYIRDLSGLQPQRNKFKSYPVSPRKSNLEETGYLSDQPLYRISYTNQYNNRSSVLSNAQVSQKPLISPLKPRSTLGSSEPFPFEVPRDPVPRQSLFYELRYGDKIMPNSLESNARPKDVAEKPIEDYDVDSITPKNNQYPHFKGSEYVESERDSVGRKTIVRIRPLSSVNRAQRQSVRTMPLRLEESLPSVSPHKYVHQVPLKPDIEQAPILMTSDGKVLHPVKEDKVGRNSQRLDNEPPTVRVSVVHPVKEYVEYEKPVSGVPMRKSLRRSLVRQSLAGTYSDAGRLRGTSLRSERDLIPVAVSGEDYVNVDFVQFMPSKKAVRMSLVQQPMEKEKTQRSEVIEKTNIENHPEPEDQSMSYGQIRHQPVVYAVPTVPTRGTRRSVLQQSVKSLTSKNQKDEPTVYRKNIRYSMDTDVFSAEPRRRSVAPSSPGYVNMEKGQPMLVSEFLNPITSLFISDLKDPVPKDPIKKPKEANVWVKPRSSSGQRNSISKQITKTIPRVQQVYQAPPQSKPQVLKKIISRKSYYKEESSSSDESIVVYRKKSKQSGPRRSYYRTAVYNAEIPSPTLPSCEFNKENFDLANQEKVPDEIPSPSSSKHICGLRLGPSEQSFLRQDEGSPPKYKVRMVSSAQQTDIENDLDLICYPSQSVLENSVLSSESNSKLRWRIIIKRGDEK